MPDDRPAPAAYAFGEFTVDAARRLLLKNGVAVPLTPKAFDTLAVLVAHRDRLVTKDELLRAVWPGTFVEENNLNQSISILRKALGERRTDHRYIVTAPGHGYRFVAEVQGITPQQAGGDQKAVHQPAARSASRVPLTRAAALVAAVLTLTAAMFLYVRGSSTRDDPDDGAGAPAFRSIAVLPFKSHSGASEGVGEEYLGVGMTDALITRLSHVRALIVRPGSAVRSFGGPGQDPLQAGRALRVDAVLDGHMQRAGDQVSVQVRLLSTATGTVLWSDSLETTWTGLLGLEDQIAERVIGTLIPELGARARGTPAVRETNDPEAYRAYLRGRYFWNKRTDEGLKSAVVEFNEAIRRDGGYARAYAGLADTYILWSVFGIAPWSEVGPKARAAALRALQMDEELAEAHTSLAFIAWTACAANDAGRSFRRAIELSPGYATAHHWYSLYLKDLGRMDEAVAEIRKAEELDPLSLVINADVALVLFYARRYDEAIQQSARTLELDPTFALAHYYQGFAYERKGMYADALRAYDRMASDDSPGSLVQIGRAHALSGNRKEALRILERLKNSPRNDTSGRTS